MQVEVGRNALEGAGAVEHRGAQPGGVRAHAHDRDVALVPIAFVERPGFRPALSRRHATPPHPFVIISASIAARPGGYHRGGWRSHAQPTISAAVSYTHLT